MKVGLLTYHCVPNFGANLQACSTVNFFKSKGIDCEVINWYPKDLEDLYSSMVSNNQILMHKDFVTRYLPMSKRLYGLDDVSEYLSEQKFDALFVGSDAVFSYFPIRKRLYLSRKSLIKYVKPTSDHCFPNPFWGVFNKSLNCKIISLSASAQYLDYSICFSYEKKFLSMALSKFSILTVRDRWTKEFVNKIIGKDKALITPDPVFGLLYNCPDFNKDDVISKFNLPTKYIVVSFCKKLFDSSWYLTLKEIFNSKGYKVINLPMPEGNIDIPSDNAIINPLDVLDWYNIIRLSSGYIGQRMHPMIVSMINKVPIVIFDHYSYKDGKDGLNSSKIYDLLERADLLDYYFNIKTMKFPKPSSIVELLLNFDNNKLIGFVDSYSELYNNFMNKIIREI